ncbi:MAG: hypothetical protein GEV10_07785 [Streptosporangiales bacterium]|nr:hypothetical protein [Streptosporangiales bacterium]
MNGKDRLGLTTTVLALLGGAWLAAAPWIVDFQTRGAAWTAYTKNVFWLGIAVSAVAFAALVVYAASALRGLTRHRMPAE